MLSPPSPAQFHNRAVRGPARNGVAHKMSTDSEQRSVGMNTFLKEFNQVGCFPVDGCVVCDLIFGVSQWDYRSLLSLVLSME